MQSLLKSMGFCLRKFNFSYQVLKEKGLILIRDIICEKVGNIPAFLCGVMSRIMGLMKNENGTFCHLNLNESFFG